tara:strand:+ start:3982 stop:4473 length:492 start_codon:yes stop_codon:yes gene_type:complete
MINDSNVEKVRKYITSPFFFRFYLFFNLPMGFISGMKIKTIDDQKCILTIPYKWLNKNPFKSTFWAVLGMAGEMNGAALILQYTYKNSPSISTLPIKSNAMFFKKATGTTIFTCNDSKRIKLKVLEAIESKESVEIITKSTGRNKSGEKICEFTFHWTIKVRS